MTRRGVLALVGAALAALLALAGCGSEADVEPVTLVGNPSGAVLTLLDSRVSRAVTAALPTSVRGRPVGIRYGTGTPDDMAATVKNGRTIDLVVLPAGPALDRVTDELVRAPVLLGSLGSTRWYGGAVTAKGLPILTYWEGPQGRVKLRRSGLR